MKAIKFENVTNILGEGREDVQPLPVHMAEGIVTACFKLDADELKHIREHATIGIRLCSYGRHPQPVSISSSKPKFPITRATSFTMATKMHTPETSIFFFTAIPMVKADILKSGLLWVSVLTFGGPLQPIQGNCIGPTMSKLTDLNGKQKRIIPNR